MSQRSNTSNAPLAPYPPMMLSQQQPAVPSKSALSPSPQYSTGYPTMNIRGGEGISSSMSTMGRGGESGSGTPSEISDQATSGFTAGDLPIKSSARTAQALPSLVKMIPSWNSVAACINCVESRSIPSIPHPPRKASVASTPSLSSFATPAAPAAPTPPRNRKVGPLLLELRQLELHKNQMGGGLTAHDDDDDGVFFTTRRIAISRGNPSLGSSVASTCLDLPVVNSYSPNTNHVAAAATGLSTGMLCIHTFGFGRDGTADGGIDGDNDGGEDNLLTSSIEYYHTPRHHRQASAVAWRPTNHNHVAIGLLGSNTSAGGHHHHQQQSGARRGTVNMSRAGGDREFCCVLFDIESQQSSSTKRNSTPISKLSHNAPVASLAWMMDGQTLAVGLQSRTIQLYDLRVPAGSNAPPISAYAHSFGVHGIEVDPHRPHIMATYCRSVGEAVKIWDCRRMDSVFSEIKVGGSGASSAPAKASSQSTSSQSISQTKVESVKWSISEPGFISVAIGDSVQDYDTNSSSSRPVLMRVNYSRNGQLIRDMALFDDCKATTNNKNQHGSSTLSYMQNNDGPNYDERRTSDKLIEALYSRRMLTVLEDRTVCDMARYTIAPLEISRRDGRLVHSLGSKIWVGSTTSGASAMERSEISNDDDISATMMRRARCSRVARYSMDTGSNIKLLSEELQKVGNDGTSDARLSLLRLWSWIERVESLCIDAEDMEDDIRFWPAKGLLDSGIWQLLGLDQEAAGSPDEDVAVYSDLLSCPIYDSPERRYALTSCGWVGKFDLPNVLGECETLGEYERSAALAVWHADIGAAVNALQRASDYIRRQDGRVANPSDSGAENAQSYAETLDLVAMCLAGFGASSSSSVWENACSSLLRRDDLSESKATSSQKAYLRGLCQYLLNVNEKSRSEQVLYNSKLSLSDRVAFACRFLDQKSLKEFLLHCIESTHATGNIEGLVVTGLSKEGIRCIQSFVDKESDVQSAALVCSRTILPTEWGIERKICLEWVEAYRGLLNTWQMWQSRSMFDVDRAEHLRRIKARGVDGAIVAVSKAGNFPGGRRSQIPPNRRQGGRMLDPDVVACLPAQLDARCNYCSAPLGLRRNEGGTNQWLSKMKSVLSCCPQCRKPLPRCAICLLPMGCLNPYMELTRERSRTPGLLRGNSLLAASQDDLSQVSNLPFAEWFTWCMRCKHGGHAHHLVGWFANHDVCPVSGCNCQCEFDGIRKLSRPAHP